jgi:hypothetical protein
MPSPTSADVSQASASVKDPNQLVLGGSFVFIPDRRYVI